MTGDVELWRRFLGQLIRDPMRLPQAATLKHSSDRQVIRAIVPFLKDTPVVCRYVRATGAAAWLDKVRGSAARRDFRRTYAMATAGIETPGPWVLIERGTVVGESWLVVQFFDRAVDLDRFALTVLPQLSKGEIRRVKVSATQAVADFLARLERSGWRHRDLKASNILINDWDGEFGESRAFVVDVEGLRRCYPWNASAGSTAIIRLAASLLDAPSVTRADFGRLLRLYLHASGRPEVEWRRLYVDLSRRAEEYARDALRRKANKLDGFTGA